MRARRDPGGAFKRATVTITMSEEEARRLVQELDDVEEDRRHVVTARLWALLEVGLRQ